MPLEYALALAHLYGEKGDRKFERAALKYLRRYMDEANPTLADVAQAAAVLAERGLLSAGCSSRYDDRYCPVIQCMAFITRIRTIRT